MGLHVGDHLVFGIDIFHGNAEVQAGGTDYTGGQTAGR